MAGPYLCGDPCCGSRGNPSACAEDVAVWERAIETLQAAIHSPEELEVAVKAGIAAAEAYRLGLHAMAPSIFDGPDPDHETGW